MTRTNTRRSQRCLRTGLAGTTVVAVLVGCSDSTPPDKSGGLVKVASLRASEYAPRVGGVGAGERAAGFPGRAGRGSAA
jgi:hypothetical protein